MAVLRSLPRRRDRQCRQGSAAALSPWSFLLGALGLPTRGLDTGVMSLCWGPYRNSQDEVWKVRETVWSALEVVVQDGRALL